MTTDTDQDLNLNYRATFTEAITPFNVSVNEDFLKLTRLKVSLTRFVDDLNLPDFTDGPPTRVAKSVAAYWTEEYDWRKIEGSINSRLSQFTTIVNPSRSPANFTSPVPVHFVHHRSKRRDAIPLLFVHGWPGSFLEVEPIISSLTDPPDESLPAFNVVAPSIPGYGFSPTPQTTGFGYRAAGATFHALMLKLGYSKYVFQGGDAGDFINRYAAHDFPDSVVSGLSNFWVIPPNDSDLERFRTKETSEDEDYIVTHLDNFFSSGWGYGQIQQTRPLKLASGLMDSPVGLAMWIYDSVAKGEPDSGLWTEERIITWTMMHWINGPYGAFSLYRNGAKVSLIALIETRCVESWVLTYSGGWRNFYSWYQFVTLCASAYRDLAVSS
jgi:epoxide hydrolase-like protein